MEKLYDEELKYRNLQNQYNSFNPLLQEKDTEIAKLQEQLEEEETKRLGILIKYLVSNFNFPMIDLKKGFNRKY